MPATRWVLSSQAKPPRGYRWSQPRLKFEAANFPEFPDSGDKSWSYDKISLREDAFNGPYSTDVEDPELEEYAGRVREALRAKLQSERSESAAERSEWEASRIAIVQKVIEDDNCVAAIQGALRMSGLFSQVEDGSSGRRFVDLCGNDTPDPSKLAQTMRLYTMFPQMPDPMPLPSTSAEELKREISSREAAMADSGRDPHRDAHGRIYTHKSTSNVSNTILGIYLTFDATGLPALDGVPALDLFGTVRVKRDWVSLQDLKVLDPDGSTLLTEDTKPTFISGFIVRQLVAEGVIDIDGPSPSET